MIDVLTKGGLVYHLFHERQELSIFRIVFLSTYIGPCHQWFDEFTPNNYNCSLN